MPDCLLAICIQGSESYHPFRCCRAITLQHSVPLTIELINTFFCSIKDWINNVFIPKYLTWLAEVTANGKITFSSSLLAHFNTLRTGDANLCFYITTVQDRWRKSVFLTCACCPCTVHLTFRHRASCILGQAFHYSPENAFYIFNQQIYFVIWYLLDRASLI